VLVPRTGRGAAAVRDVAVDDPVDQVLAVPVGDAVRAVTVVDHVDSEPLLRQHRQVGVEAGDVTVWLSRFELTADISEFGRHFLIIHVINVGGK
jgi:hypothetical protein